MVTSTVEATYVALLRRGCSRFRRAHNFDARFANFRHTFRIIFPGPNETLTYATSILARNRLNAKMKFIVLAFSLSFLGQLSDAYDCSICGPGMMVGDGEGVIAIPGRENRTCSDVQALGDRGLITTVQCSELVPLVQIPCNCTPFVCSLCPNYDAASDLGGVINIPEAGIGLITCSAVQKMAMVGDFNQTFCPTVQSIAEGPCGCPSGSSPNVSTTSGPTLTPRQTRYPRNPTPRPTRAPSKPDFAGGHTLAVSFACLSVVVLSLANLAW